jgi:hypothetical protein
MHLRDLHVRVLNPDDCEQVHLLDLQVQISFEPPPSAVHLQHDYLRLHDDLQKLCQI